MAAAKETPKPADTAAQEAEKLANFKRRASGYVNSALDGIVRLGDLSVSRNVISDPALVSKAFAAIREACDTAEARYASPKAAKSGFSF